MSHRAATMEKTIFLLILCTAIEGDIKHFFVPKEMAWLDAQAYCRLYYTDLSFVNSQSDQDQLKAVVQQSNSKGWIGLYRDPSNITGWRWSGGGYITYQNWVKGQPDNYQDLEHNAEVFTDGKWNDIQGTQSKNFYCISLGGLVGVKMTWENALNHCRKTQASLTSLLSNEEHLLAKEMIQQDHISERVWIGLRHVGDHWLWVNGEPLEYQAWPQRGDQDHQCPIQKRCGALTKDGLWENWDCQEELNFICI